MAVAGFWITRRTRLRRGEMVTGSMADHSSPGVAAFVHSAMPPEPTPTSAQLTDADVRRIAKLARLSISEAEVAQHREALSRVLGYMETLRKVDLSGIEVAGAAGIHGGAGGDGMGSHLGPDVPGETLANEALMRIAPRTMSPFVLVPKVLGDGGGA